MFMYAICGWLFGSGSAFGLGYMMCGLFIACLWIIFDTQVIVEQSERGYRNVADHSLTLFIDLFDLFIKILRILNELDEKKDKKKR
jgi:FtsH-binding integral membrane protein